MKANLLLVSASEFPSHISDFLEKHGFTCSFSRGRIRTKEILTGEKIDAIIWLYLGNESALAQDLLSIFNEYRNTPIIFVTQTYDELDFAEDIQGLFANLDLNDDLEDFLKTAEIACNITPSTEGSKAIREAVSAPPEIDFKNAVSHIFATVDSDDSSIEPREISQNISTWNAVDKAERQILSEPYRPNKNSGLRKLKKLFNK